MAKHTGGPQLLHPHAHPQLAHELSHPHVRAPQRTGCLPLILFVSLKLGEETFEEEVLGSRATLGARSQWCGFSDLAGALERS